MLVPILRQLTACVFASATVHAGTPLGGFSPVEVGEGPLVFLIHPEDESGRSLGGRERTEVMYLCDPGIGAKATPVWRGNIPLVTPLRRLTKNLTVVERGYECYVWDMSAGSATPLWAGGDQTSFLKAEGSKVFFLRRLLPDTSNGMKVGSGKDGKKVAESWWDPLESTCRHASLSIL